MTVDRMSGAVVHRDPTPGPPSGSTVTEWRIRLRMLLVVAVAKGFDNAAVLAECRRELATFAVPTSDTGGDPTSEPGGNI